MKKTKKHTAPLRCRLRVRLRKPDWTGFAVCDVGAGACRKCQGCEHYKPDKVRDNIIEATDLLKEHVHKVSEAFNRLKLELTVRLSEPIYELAEEEQEEEDHPWLKKNPHLHHEEVQEDAN